MNSYSGLPRPSRRIIYRRNLPGGGFVNIEAESGSTPEEQPHRAMITVERRSDPARRDGHQPPVVAVAEGPTSQGVFRQMLDIAADNIAIARALLRSQADGRPRF